MPAQDTKHQLLKVAERLFAEFGIEAVSPRQIALAAGQRNESAIRYHFGSKDALIAALHRQRMAEVNQKRRAMLAEMEDTGRMGDLRALIGAVALPLIEKVSESSSDAYYARFLAHLFADRRRRNLAIARGEEAAVLRSIFQAMRSVVQGLPEPLWTERLRLMIGGIVNGIADRTRLKATNDPEARALADAAFTENLLDVAVAVLREPASARTLASLRTVKVRRAKEMADVTNS